MIYDSPAFRAMELKHKTVLMAGSPEKKPDAPKYGDWMGARSVGGIDFEEEESREIFFFFSVKKPCKGEIA